MKNEVKVSVELTTKNKVIVKNDKNMSWSFNFRKGEEERPIYMISSIITSLLNPTIINVMNYHFENKIQFTLRFDEQ